MAYTNLRVFTITCNNDFVPKQPADSIPFLNDVVWYQNVKESLIAAAPDPLIIGGLPPNLD